MAGRNLLTFLRQSKNRKTTQKIPKSQSELIPMIRSRKRESQQSKYPFEFDEINFFLKNQ